MLLLEECDFRENGKNKKSNIPIERTQNKKYSNSLGIKYSKKMIICIVILKIIKEFHQFRMIGKLMTWKANELL